jgi:hypothetical protein
VSERHAILIALLLLSAQAVRADVRTVKSIEGAAPGKRVRMEGTLSSQGGATLAVLVLQTEGNAVTLRPHTPAIQHELTNLNGVRVAVEGEVLTPLDETIPRLDVNAYEILSFPDAGEPIIGTLDAECVLTTTEGRRYWITGALAPALCEHAGARVWMVGKKARAGGERPAKSTPFTPTGYGVIE